MLNWIGLKLNLASPEQNRLKKDGFLKKTPWDGFSGIADKQMEEELKRLMKFKLEDGKTSLDM